MSNLRESIITGSNGTENFIFAFGEQLSTKKHDDISTQFQYNYLDTRFDLRAPVTTGDGAVTSADSKIRASSAVTGTAIIVSRNAIRYRPGHSGYADFTLRADGTGTAKGGAFDELQQNGFQLKIVNNNASFGYLKSGVEKGSYGAAGFDDQSSWNGNLNVSGLDLTKLNI